MYYLNSRYYDSEIGRFINADNFSILEEGKDFFNGLNLYAYCGNNPVMNTDETGNAWWHWLIGALVVAFAAVAVVVTAGAALGAGAGISAILSASMTAVSSVALGGSAMTLGLTIASGIFIGSLVTFGGFALFAGIEAISSGSMNTFWNYGESAMWSTFGGGALGGISGYLQYKSANTFSGTHTPGKSTPYSKYKNISNPNDITITHYDYQGNMFWSKHLGDHGYQGHSAPHWHFEMPHRGLYNSRLDFIIEYLRNVWWLK